MENNSISKNFAPLMLRLSLAGVFFWFGINQILNSHNWVYYLPDFVLKLPADPTLFVFLNGTLEVILGLFLVLGFFTRLSALVLGLHLLAIAVTMGMSAIAVRDAGLGFACLSICLQGSGGIAVDSYIKKLKETGFSGTAFKIATSLILLAVVIAVLALYVYEQKNNKALSLAQTAYKTLVT